MSRKMKMHYHHESFLTAKCDCVYIHTVLILTFGAAILHILSSLAGPLLSAKHCSAATARCKVTFSGPQVNFCQPCMSGSRIHVWRSTNCRIMSCCI